MHVIVSDASRLGPHRRSVALGTIVGLALFAGGLGVAWLTFGTPFISRFTPTGRPDTSEMLAGMLAWTFALIAPAAFILAGLARLAAVVEGLSSRRAVTARAARLARQLGDQHVVVARMRLPDGRLVPEMVIGPFGVAVIEELPPPAVSRHRGGTWEVRSTGGRWMPLENPLERAARDAERVRRWFASDDQDFVVRVYAAVVGTDPEVERTPACAVVRREQVPAWIASLPTQRSLTPARRARLIELLTRGTTARAGSGAGT